MVKTDKGNLSSDRHISDDDGNPLALVAEAVSLQSLRYFGKLMVVRFQSWSPGWHIAVYPVHIQMSHSIGVFLCLFSIPSNCVSWFFGVYDLHSNFTCCWGQLLVVTIFIPWNCIPPVLCCFSPNMWVPFVLCILHIMSVLYKSL